MINKKAVSAVVATVLIILITVAAITIIWTAVIPMIQKNIEGGTTCLDAQSQVSLETEGGYTCKKDFSVAASCTAIAKDCGRSQAECTNSSCAGIYTQAVINWSVQLQISHGNEDFALEDVNVGIGSGGNTETKKLVGEGITTSDGLPGQNEEKKFLITGLQNNPDKLEISPVIRVGATTKPCPVSSTVSVLQVCTS